jgi:hypothetical protein
MMGRQDRDQRQLFYEFSLDEMIPTDHLLRRIDVFATAVLADLHDQLKAFYSDIEGDLAFLSLVGLDSESQQARAVRVVGRRSAKHFGDHGKLRKVVAQVGFPQDSIAVRPSRVHRSHSRSRKFEPMSAFRFMGS